MATAETTQNSAGPIEVGQVYRVGAEVGDQFELQLCDIEGRFGQKSEIPVRLWVRSALGPRTVEDEQAQRSMAGGNGFSPGG